MKDKVDMKRVTPLFRQIMEQFGTRDVLEVTKHTPAILDAIADEDVAQLISVNKKVPLDTSIRDLCGYDKLGARGKSMLEGIDPQVSIEYVFGDDWWMRKLSGEGYHGGYTGVTMVRRFFAGSGYDIKKMHLCME